MADQPSVVFIEQFDVPKLFGPGRRGDVIPILPVRRVGQRAGVVRIVAFSAYNPAYAVSQHGDAEEFAARLARLLVPRRRAAGRRGVVDDALLRGGARHPTTAAADAVDSRVVRAGGKEEAPALPAIRGLIELGAIRGRVAGRAAEAGEIPNDHTAGAAIHIV